MGLISTTGRGGAIGYRGRDVADGGGAGFRRRLYRTSFLIGWVVVVGVGSACDPSVLLRIKRLRPLTMIPLLPLPLDSRGTWTTLGAARSGVDSEEGFELLLALTFEVLSGVGAIWGMVPQS
jgi:hypothetical protein